MLTKNLGRNILIGSFIVLLIVALLLLNKIHRIDKDVEKRWSTNKEEMLEKYGKDNKKNLETYRNMHEEELEKIKEKIKTEWKNDSIIKE